MQTNFEYHSRRPKYQTIEEYVFATRRLLEQLTAEIEDFPDIDAGDIETEGLQRIAIEDLHATVWKAANDFEGKLR
jgi:hypothetical protein